MITRFTETYLQHWHQKSHRKPLVLRGARQVGKSTLVRQFAQAASLHLCEINLERHMDLDAVFKTLDLAVIIRELESIIGAVIRQPGSLLFLDEIQATPHALQALRYFYEDTPDIPVIAAGSLLEFTLASHTFSMPVGRIEYYHLGPITFKEFLQATEPYLANLISEYRVGDTIPAQAHKNLLAKQREYLFTGGMPEAVHVYTETGAVTEVSAIHRSIAETYQDDFSKYAQRKELALMQRIFRIIPAIIGQKVKYSNLSRDHRAKDVRAIIDLLAKALVCHQVFHSDCSGVPLYADINENIYKLLGMDVGIVNHLCGIDIRAIGALSDQELVNKGAVAEQFIGQHLMRLQNEQPRLCYWLREGKSANAEVDYIISRGMRIIPVEVKAGKSGSLKSLQQIMLHKHLNFAIRFDTNPPSLQEVRHATSSPQGTRPVIFSLLSLPLYLVEECLRLVDDAQFS